MIIFRLLFTFLSMLIIIIYFLSTMHCTIDMTVEQFEYIASQLTMEECRRLAASLFHKSFDLPTVSLAEVEKQIPKDVPCTDLLLAWNSGEKKWEGRGKTHVEVERRLRQLGKSSLADWLGVTVFHQLAQDVNESLLNQLHFGTVMEPYTLKLFKETEPPDQVVPWVVFDFVMWIVFLGLLTTLLILYFRIIYLTSKTHPKKHEREEMRSLLGDENVINMEIEDRDNEDSIFT